MAPSTLEITATVLFALALIHTFSVKFIQGIGSRYPEGSPEENFFHLMGEVEVVFGLWAAILTGYMTIQLGYDKTVTFLESLNYTEPLFVFAIMTVASTRPVLALCDRFIRLIARLLPLPPAVAFFATVLTIGPLLGSFITEPAAMTVTALILKDRYFEKGMSSRFLYATLAVLFVNISIGGVLTPYAAPPVLMVAARWKWDLTFMLSHFGWKACIGILANSTILTLIFWKPLKKLSLEAPANQTRIAIPVWVFVVHLIFLAGIVLTAHHAVVFIALLLFFLGVVKITSEYQTELKLRESLLVGFFLAGLVVLGALQAWWLEPALMSLGPNTLFLGATGLTGIVDNAALTYLGSRVPGLSAQAQYALVAGAVAGGGLTVIANAPNPAGYSILQKCFGVDGIQPGKLLLYALLPTIIAMACLWLP